RNVARLERDLGRDAADDVGFEADVELADGQLFTDVRREALRERGIVADGPFDVLAQREYAFADVVAVRDRVLAITHAAESFQVEIVATNQVAAVTGAKRGLVVEAAEAIVGVRALAVQVLVFVEVEV